MTNLTSENVAIRVGFFQLRHEDVPIIKWIAKPSQGQYSLDQGFSPSHRFCYQVACATCGHTLKHNQWAWQFRHELKHRWARLDRREA